MPSWTNSSIAWDNIAWAHRQWTRTVTLQASNKSQSSQQSKQDRYSYLPACNTQTIEREGCNQADQYLFDQSTIYGKWKRKTELTWRIQNNFSNLPYQLSILIYFVIFLTFFLLTCVLVVCPHFFRLPCLVSMSGVICLPSVSLERVIPGIETFLPLISNLIPFISISES